MPLLFSTMCRESMLTFACTASSIRASLDFCSSRFTGKPAETITMRLAPGTWAIRLTRAWSRVICNGSDWATRQTRIGLGSSLETTSCSFARSSVKSITSRQELEKIAARSEGWRPAMLWSAASRNGATVPKSCSDTSSKK